MINPETTTEEAGGATNIVPYVLRAKEATAPETLDDLFAQARNLGLVYFYTFDDGRYSVDIKFTTLEHTIVKATGGINFTCPREAFKAAIAKATQIRNAFK